MASYIRSTVFSLALIAATGAQAAGGIATATINLRTGPGVQYASMGKIPNGVSINVNGCTSGYGWCRVNYRGINGWASSRYIAFQINNGGYTNNNNFGATAAAIGIPLIAGLAINSAINTNRWDRGPRWGDRPYGHRSNWGPRPYRVGPGWGGPGHWGPPRPHWNDGAGWRNHPGYHPNFFGPGNRWRSHGWR